MRPGGERVSIIDGISDMPWIPTGERSEIIDAHRDGTRFVVRADEKIDWVFGTRMADSSLTLKAADRIVFPE